MLCSNCGSENRAGLSFCTTCGRELDIVCPNCRVRNASRDKFCGSCGYSLAGVVAPLVDAAQMLVSQREPHERRFVAILFADLVGFTPFSEDRDHEIVRAALTKYFDRSREIIERFGGVVDKFIGDAVMAVWGATVALEDDAERAVRAGLELTDMVARLGDEFEGTELSLRVGVLTGEASVGPLSTDQGLIVGDLVNTASRLQSIADPGTVVVGEATYRMLADVVQFEPLGARELKGKAAPVQAWRAVRVKTDRTQRSREMGWEPPFVGREAELRLLKDAFHATEKSGRARLVSIIGEPGIGKTRLGWELRKYLGGLAEQIYWHDGRSPAYSRGLTFWALGEMVRQRAGIAETEDALRSRTKLRTAVTEYVSSPADQDWIEPRLAALLGLEARASEEQGEFFAAVRLFFHSIGERGPTVLLFEDFHWADSGLVDFVAELVERSTSVPILVVTLARPDLLERVPGWGAGRRNFTSAHLGPLTDIEMSELITGMVQGLDPEVADLVATRANGVPLYAVELVRMLLTDGDLIQEGECCVPAGDLANIRVPDTVRAVIEARLDRLRPQARALLEDAAVLGARFTSEGLIAVSRLPAPTVEALLEPLVHGELLEFETDPDSPGRGQYRFVQSMIRELAYGRLTREERRVRHIRAAEYFDDLEELELTGAVAGHYMAAHSVTDEPEQAGELSGKAINALSDAAERAALLHSHAQALALLEQAMGLMPDAGAQPSFWQRAAKSAGSLALNETAVGYAYRAYDRIEATGDPVATAQAATLVASQLCHAYRAPEAVEVLTPIVRADPELTEPAVVEAAAELARAHLMALETEAAAELADRVMGPAERLGLVPTIINTLITRGTALGDLGRLHEAIALLRGAATHARERGLVMPEMRASNNLGHLLAFDDHVGALEACRAGMDQANRIGDVRFIGSFTWAVAAYLDRDGRFDESRRLRTEVRERIQIPATSNAWYELADLTVAAMQGEEGAIAAARGVLAEATSTADPQSQASAPLVRARLELLAGDYGRAYEAALAVEREHRSPDHLAAAVTAAALLRDAGRLEHAVSELAGMRSRGRMVRALIDVGSGALAASRGRRDEAVAGFSSALEFGFLRLDRSVIQALFAAVMGRDVAEARSASDAAYAVFMDAGARGYLDLFGSVLPPPDEYRAAGE